MKLIIVADVHGDYQRLCDVVDAEKGAEALIFLGDGLPQVDMLGDEHPELRVYTVRGNCDYASFSPTEAMISFGGVNFFYTHGHLYGVKNGYDDIAQTAKARGADAVLFGHTHQPLLTKVDGITLFNPGALSSYRSGMGSYGIAEVNDGKVTFEHKKIK